VCLEIDIARRDCGHSRFSRRSRAPPILAVLRQTDQPAECVAHRALDFAAPCRSTLYDCGQQRPEQDFSAIAVLILDLLQLPNYKI
jgi:hypothetical protein